MKALWSNLGTRLILAMLVVALFSSAVIVLSQYVGARLHFQTLPAEVREDILNRKRRPPPPPVFDPGHIDEENASPETLEREDFVRGLATVQDYQRRATWVGLALAALLASFLALRLSRSISGPIERVSNAANQLAEGDLNVRVPEQTGTSHEVQTLTQNFNTMARSLDHGEQERRAMVADIAHELRTPLAAMKLRFQGLEDDLIPLDKAQVKKLHQQTDVLTRLVQDLRTLSLADAGRLSLQQREVDVVQLLKDLCDTYEVKAQELGVQLEFSSTHQTLVTSLDPERMTQIVSNLLDNALRVTPEHGRVVVTLEATADNILIHVADTGPGLSEEALKHLFDRFFQDRDTQGSSGLGLAIVKALVELHGGTVSASNYEKGARFSLHLAG